MRRRSSRAPEREPANCGNCRAEELWELWAIEYTSLEVAQADLSRVDELLNEMGQDRWDCYHVAVSGQERVFYFKRNKTNAAAYLTNLFRLGAVAF